MSKVLFIILLILIFASGNVFSHDILPPDTTKQTTVKEEERENFKINMARAWLKFNDGDYRGALRVYRTLYEKYPENASLNFRMGACFVSLKEMGDAIKHLVFALKTDSLIDKDLLLLLGEAYQYEGKEDEALDCYYRFKLKLTPGQLAKHSVNDLWGQCMTAKELTAKPVDVTITNMGGMVNSKFTDACPSITADGKTLIFTSRRPENTGGLIDPNTEEYFDDVYISTWNESSKSWNMAIPMPAPINTDGHDANTSISPDGTQIFVYKNLEGMTRSGDIYVSSRLTPAEWSKPVSVCENAKFPNIESSVNSSYFESSACVTADGNTMYFVSERIKGAFGNGDIYLARKEGSSWSEPVNLGSVINTVDDEIGVFIHPDGKTLFFSSNGHNTMGGYDIFMSRFENNMWITPINVGFPVNTTKDEYHFILSLDGKTAYISSSRDGGLGKIDIYKVDMTNYFKSNRDLSKDAVDALSGPVLSIVKGTVVDAETSEPISVNLLIYDADDNKEVANITSNEKGEYFATLPSDKKYEIKVNSDKYKPLDTKFKLPKGTNDTYTLTKHLILNKK